MILPSQKRAAPPPALPRRRRRERDDAVAFWVFVGPLLLGLTVFFVVPLVWSALLSLSDARGTVDLGRWTGLDNYRRLLADPNFLRSLRTSVVFTALIVPTTLGLGLGLALLVTSVRRGQALFRTVFFLPTAVSYVVATLIWKLSLFSGLRFGVVNQLLAAFGAAPVNWTYDVPPLWVVLISVRLWLQLGFNMLLFIAGLNEVPRSLYEAARIDGAGPWTLFSRITWPLLRNTTIFVLFTNVIAGFLAFDEFFNVMNGSGNGASLAGSLGVQPPLWFIYNAAFGGGGQDYGLASAGSFVLAGLLLLATLLQIRLFGLGRSNT